MPKSILRNLLVIVVLFASGTVMADRPDAIYVPVGTLVLNPPSDIVAVRSPVSFPHSLHFSYACGQCHHKWNGLTKIKNCMAAGCHRELDPPKKSDKALAYDMDAIVYFKYAYHKRCIGCHKEIRATNKAAENNIMITGGRVTKIGPVGCVGCHERE